jgi:NitT/TauT family transport system substrate-binding protein
MTCRARTTTVLAGAVFALFAAGTQGAVAASKLSIGMPTSPPNLVHMAPYIARDLGFFKDAGLDVDILSLEGGVKTYRAMVSGDLDVASASGPFSMVGRARGAKTRMILANVPKLESTMTVQGKIKSLADLKGKRIGIQQPGGFAWVLSMMVLRKAKLKEGDVSFVSILSEDVPPLVAGQIDTAILHVEQFMLAKSKKPDLHVIAKLWEVAPTQLYNALVVREDTIAKRRNDLVAFSKGIIRATRLIYTDKATVQPIMVKHSGLGARIVSDAYDELVANCVWNANIGLTKKRVNSTAAQMKRVGNIKGDVPTYEQIVDLSIADAALKDLGTYKGSTCTNVD